MAERGADRSPTSSPAFICARSRAPCTTTVDGPMGQLLDAEEDGLSPGRLFDLSLGPVALSFVGASGKKDLKRIRALHSQLGAAPTGPSQWGVEDMKVASATAMASCRRTDGNVE